MSTSAWGDPRLAQLRFEIAETACGLVEVECMHEVTDDDLLLESNLRRQLRKLAIRYRETKQEVRLARLSAEAADAGTAEGRG